jgi:exosome complex component RRP40
MQASGFGPLKQGHVITCSTSLARSLLTAAPCPVLDILGNTLQFELAVGQNGRIWINAPCPATVILIANAVERSEFLSSDQSRLLVHKLLERLTPDAVN